MSQIWAALIGKKTYIVSLVTIGYALAQYFLSGDMPLPEAAKMIEGALIAMTVRHGMATALAQLILSLGNGGQSNATPQQSQRQYPPPGTNLSR